MKLDWNLCREIMVACENADDGTDADFLPSIDGQDPRLISYHVRRLGQAGYLDVETLPDDEDFDFTWHMARSVTYEGHRFLAATRDEKTWKRALRTAGSKAGSVTLETILALAIAEGKRRLGLPD